MQLSDSSSAPAITGLILAGGRATRMQHHDKGLQQLHGISLIEHVLARLTPQVASVLINANRNQANYALLGYPVISDIRADFAGPLAGVEAGLAVCNSPFLLTVPCDTPYFPLNLAERLLAALIQANADIAMACTGELSALQSQPVFCLLKPAHLPQLQQYLDGGGRKMDAWFGALAVAKVLFTDDAEFTNMNTLEQLK